VHHCNHCLVTEPDRLSNGFAVELSPRSCHDF
jgi:hypothetical protein